MCKHIRRCGVGVARCTTTGEIIFGLHTPLPGDVQSVGRGELFALVLLLEHVDAESSITFVTDNYGVYSVYINGKKAASNSANCDLWDIVYQLISGKRLPVALRWMPSHLDKLPRSEWPSHVTEADVLSNAHADRLAGEAAKDVQVPFEIAVPIMIIVKRAAIVQRRLATILINLPKRVLPKRHDLQVASPAEERPKLDLGPLLAETSHRISIRDGRYFCVDCLNGFHSRDSSLKAWLQSTCVKPVDDRAHPASVLDTIHMGNQVTHASHSIKSYRALIYCSKCGCYANMRELRALAEPCLPPTFSGRRVLRYIKEGKPPYGMCRWPDEEPNC